MNTALANNRSCRTEWLTQGGLDEVLPTNSRNMANRLVRYISDASTVRVRVLEHYGTAPDLGTIKAMRAEWMGRMESYRELSTYGGEALGDDGRPDPVAKKPAAEFRLPLLVVPDDPEPVVAQAPSLPIHAPIRAFSMRTMPEVLQVCADTCEITHGELIGTMRHQKYTRARNLAAAILWARGNSLPQTGRYLGDRDHTTVMNGIKRFFSRDIHDPALMAAWMRFAPCAMKAARSYGELAAMVATRT